MIKHEKRSHNVIINCVTVSVTITDTL